MLAARGHWVQQEKTFLSGRRADGRGHISFSSPHVGRYDALAEVARSYAMRPVGAQASGDDSLTLQLGASMEAAATARRALARLRADIDPPLLETLRLLVTELVTNSIRHARSDAVVLRVLVGPAAVWTEVTDTGPGFDPAATGAPRDDRSGWGLFLVERLADRWGASHDEGATKVWFELRRT